MFWQKSEMTHAPKTRTGHAPSPSQRAKNKKLFLCVLLRAILRKTLASGLLLEF